jgi:thioredoxin
MSIMATNNTQDNHPASILSLKGSDLWQTEVIEASATKPVYVDFWATWCQPCLMFAPILHRVADEMKDSFKFVKLDVDSARDISFKYGVRSIPTSMVFFKGEPFKVQVGLMPEGAFKSFLQTILNEVNGANSQSIPLAA